MHCHPSIQKFWKTFQFTKLNQSRIHCHRQRFKFNNRLLGLLLFPLFLFKHTHAVHPLPGTNYALAQGERSLDTTRQHQHIDNIITGLQTDALAPPALCMPGQVGTPSTSAHIRHEPICFIADTDSVSYTIDTAANRIIVIDAGMLTDLKICSSTIKGVGGKGVRITGTGKLKLPLTSDSGAIDVISGLEAVLVPTCPYNLIPPQILIEQMKLKGYNIKYFSHDDKNYWLKYSPPIILLSVSPSQSLLVAIKCSSSAPPPDSSPLCLVPPTTALNTRILLVQPTLLQITIPTRPSSPLPNLLCSTLCLVKRGSHLPIQWGQRGSPMFKRGRLQPL